MIFGSKTAALALALLGLSPLGAQTAEPATTAAPQPMAATTAVSDAWIAALGQPAPARTAFAEARFMQMLEQPLVLSGELSWLGGTQLQRRVEQPRKELSTIADGAVTQQREGRKPRHFSLERAPQLQVLVNGFVAMLGGDAALLRQGFEIRRQGDPAGQWQLTLVPRDAGLLKAVSRIRIDGRGHVPHCLWMEEAGGDLSVDLLGPLAARMPAQPSREGLARLCRGEP